jgi:magnesium-transporting ATPase (P-type)
MVIGTGVHSQWGKIKANLVSETVNTPLQDKLEDMAKFVSYSICLACVRACVLTVCVAVFTGFCVWCVCCVCMG